MCQLEKEKEETMFETKSFIMTQEMIIIMVMTVLV